MSTAAGASWARVAAHGRQGRGAPVSSYGVIVRRREQGRWLYLIVQRRDSYAYVEFMRGRYDVRNREHLYHLVSCMSAEERSRMLSGDFDDMWRGFWRHNPKCMQRADYHSSRERYETLRDGFSMKLLDGDTVRLSIAGIVNDTYVGVEPEWGFPKGRKLSRGEEDAACALRELAEETGITGDLLDNFGLHRVQEVYVGDNGETYRHVYYTADLREGSPSDIHVCEREIRAAAWCAADDVLHAMRGRPERCSMFASLSEGWEPAAAPLGDHAPRAHSPRAASRQ